jgi:hypothetical protein
MDSFKDSVAFWMTVLGTLVEFFGVFQARAWLAVIGALVVADSGRSGALIPFEVGQRSVAMWGRIPLGSGALFRLQRNRAPLAGIVPHI